MIHFFRKIRRKLLTNNRLGKYLFYAFGEIILVVIGILIALQINNWNEQRKVDNTAKILANSLVQDLDKDISFLEELIVFSEKKIAYCDELIALLKTPKETWDRQLFYEKMNIIGQSNPFFTTDGTYQQIVTTGSLKYFDQELANLLNAYHTNIKQITYWYDVEDKTLWLTADLLFKAIDVQGLAELRFDKPQQTEQIIDIPEESLLEFTNLTVAVQTYRLKTLVEYREQLELAKAITTQLKSSYQIPDL